MYIYVYITIVLSPAGVQKLQAFHQRCSFHGTPGSTLAEEGILVAHNAHLTF